MIDFGVVKEIVQGDGLGNPTSSIMAGTPGYMPLEQSAGKPVFASDLYALGMTIICVTTRKSPGDLNDPLTGDTLWRPHARTVGDEFASVLDKAVEPNFRDRYKTAKEMLEAVQIAVNSSGTTIVRPKPAPSPVPVWEPKPVLSPTFVNSIGMKFVLIQPGTFLMGSDKYDNEKPIHEVTISRPFYLGIHQVTQAQWKAVMDNNPSHFKGDDLPVETVSWKDAQGFIKQLNAREKTEAYRLPSEAEWEYACRAGTTGDFAGNLEEMAWYYENSGDRRLNGAEWKVEMLNSNNCRTHPVGQKKPNAWGLYDMHGNVWEWCEDVRHDDYNGAPTDGSAWTQGKNQHLWVLHGGSWAYVSDYCRSACRVSLGVGRGTYGFRVCCAVGTQ